MIETRFVLLIAVAALSIALVGLGIAISIKRKDKFSRDKTKIKKYFREQGIDTKFDDENYCLRIYKDKTNICLLKSDIVTFPVYAERINIIYFAECTHDNYQFIRKYRRIIYSLFESSNI
ncbi:hypothetical protein [Liquorilactobacillus hordei]|uniref:hypothetical protein n=1 Tax=Liquorilactobacillus hordei TaxID=468911 RepID=UPI00070BF671|nr:hypothetical protein [Liquorilactobacillus hordei]QYH51045.1 hypothetical protein G6O70_00330 [Liquorilactobacillus hordei DSM 19519]